MNVLIISPFELPIPATKGGAVQSLIESIIKCNETKPNFILTVAGIYDKEAQEKCDKLYPRTRFIFLKKNPICNLIDYLYERLFVIIGKPHKVLKNYCWKLQVIRKVKKILKQNNYDKIILENSGYLLKILKDKKILNKYKDKVYYHLHNDIPDNIGKKELKKCKILAVSRYLKQKIEDEVNDYNFDDNFFVLKNGINTNLFNQKIMKKDKEVLQKKLGIKDKEKIILYTGRINKEKGIEELINAFEKIDDQKAKLLIVGSHNFGSNQKYPFETRMRKKFDKLSNKILFTGFVDYNDIWKYYKISNIAVLPSIWNEPAGLTMIEAACAGLPVITTNSGGIPEYLNTKYAIILERDNKIVDNIRISINNLLENKKEAIRLGEAASRYVEENFDESSFYENFVEIIKK